MSHSTAYRCVTECANGLESKWWGPAWWTVLYSLADAKVSHREYGIRTLASALPCRPCRENFARHLQDYSNDNVLEWLKLAHERASNHRLGSPVTVAESARASQQSVAFVARCIAVNFPLNLTDERCTSSTAALSYLAAVFRELTPEEKPLRAVKGDLVYKNVFSYDPVPPGSSCTRAEIVAAVERALTSSCAVRKSACSTSLEALRYCAELEGRLLRYLEGYRTRVVLRSSRTVA